MPSFVPKRLNFTVYQGSDWVQDILLLDPTDPTGSTPYVFPWTKARLQLCEDYETPILLELTTENGGIVLTPGQGKIQLSISAATSQLLDLNGDFLVLIYDLIGYDTQVPPDTVRAAQGSFFFWPEVGLISGGGVGPVPPSPAVGIWGGITGTLSDQIDLAAALAGKATAAQGAEADSALQPGDVGTAAFQNAGAFDPAGAASTAQAAAISAAATDASTKASAAQSNAITAAATDATTKASAAQAASTPIAHATNTSNPHAVTKTQVGLGNVDNTSDANKPVSTAQATAIAAAPGAAAFPFVPTGTSILKKFVNGTDFNAASTNWNFGFNSFNVNPSGRPDNVVSFGWNVAANGGPEIQKSHHLE